MTCEHRWDGIDGMHCIDCGIEKIDTFFFREFFMLQVRDGEGRFIDTAIVHGSKVNRLLLELSRKGLRARKRKLGDETIRVIF